MKTFVTKYKKDGKEYSGFVKAESWEDAELKKEKGHEITGEFVEEVSFIMESIKKLLILLLAIPLLAFQCEPDEEVPSVCNCNVETWIRNVDTNDYYFNGQSFGYPNDNCENDGLIYSEESYTSPSGLNFFIQQIVKCEPIE